MNSSSIESILAEEGFYLFTGTGDSMNPLIREGVDTVEVRPVLSPLKKGDVVLFRIDGKLVLHRIIDISGDILSTRGDNNSQNETVAADKVIGIMTALWRGNRKVALTSLKYRLYVRLCLRFPFSGATW